VQGQVLEVFVLEGGKSVPYKLEGQNGIGENVERKRKALLFGSTNGLPVKDRLPVGQELASIHASADAHFVNLLFK
jgi:hypothetical protein